MSCGKCGGCGNGGRSKKLCPVSFGLAVGVVAFFGMLFWSLWIMYYGMPPMMVAMHLPTPTIQDSFVHALLGLLKGFLFGFFVALFYDLFSCWCVRCKSKENCECGERTPPQMK